MSILRKNKTNIFTTPLLSILYYQILKMLRLKKKYIVFMSFLDNDWGSYEEAIFERIYKKNKETHEILWISNTLPEKHKNKKIKVVKQNTFKASKTLAKASYVISGTYTKMPFISKKTTFFYLNHGYSVKTMGEDWVKEVKGFRRFVRRIANNNQNKQIDICFVHDMYDRESYSRIFNHNGRKEMIFVNNGFPKIKKYEKGEDVLFLPSWHEESEVVFPKLSMKNKFVSPHPRTKMDVVPDGWKKIDRKERDKLKLKYVFSDNSAAPIEYIKSGIQVYWFKSDYDRNFCQEFLDKYDKLIIYANDFKPLPDDEYNEIVKGILNAPYGEESIDITIESMGIE